jgi:hypothetical protein
MLKGRDGNHSRKTWDLLKTGIVTAKKRVKILLLRG